MKYSKSFWTFMFIFVHLLLFSNTYAENLLKEQNPQFPKVLHQVMPAVVNIIVQGQLKLPLEALPGSPQEAVPNQEGGGAAPNAGEGPKFNSVGSGVILDPKNGYIVTNAHLIREAKTIVVMLSDGRKLRANKIGVDEATDLAVLQIEPRKLTSIPLADISQLKVGDFVAAIGNPFGLHHTVTSGMVSALNRSHIIEKPKAYENFIQTDASINPGNSGGALINIKGELVGINTAIVGPISGNVGIGFAIPVDMVAPVMQQLIKYGKVNRGLLGITVQDFTPNLADAFNMGDVAEGALITDIKPNSPADKAGLKTKDVILQINNTVIKNAAHLRSLIAVLPVGSTLELTIRDDKETKKIKATTQADKTDQSVIHPKNPLTGIQLQNYDAFSLETGELKGVEVTYVDDNSDGWIAGLRPGDIILSAYSQRTESIDSLLKWVEKNQNKPLLINIWRSGGNFFIVIP